MKSISWEQTAPHKFKQIRVQQRPVSAIPRLMLLLGLLPHRFHVVDAGSGHWINEIMLVCRRQVSSTARWIFSLQFLVCGPFIGYDRSAWPDVFTDDRDQGLGIRLDTLTRKHRLVPTSTPPNSHCSFTKRPLPNFLFTSMHSSMSTTVPVPPRPRDEQEDTVRKYLYKSSSSRPPYAQIRFPIASCNRFGGSGPSPKNK